MLTVQPCTLMVLFAQLHVKNVKDKCQIWQVNPTLHADRLVI